MNLLFNLINILKFLLFHKFVFHQILLYKIKPKEWFLFLFLFNMVWQMAIGFSLICEIGYHHWHCFDCLLSHKSLQIKWDPHQRDQIQNSLWTLIRGKCPSTSIQPKVERKKKPSIQPILSYKKIKEKIHLWVLFINLRIQILHFLSLQIVNSLICEIQ